MSPELSNLWKVVQARFYLEHSDFYYYRYHECVAVVIGDMCMAITNYLAKERDRQQKLKNHKPKANKLR